MNIAQKGATPPVPEPFWYRTWRTFWCWRPGCTLCDHRKFKNRGEWERHYLSEHTLWRLRWVTTAEAENRGLFRQVIVRMPRELHDAIKQRAADEKRTMSQMVRRAIRCYLEGGPE